MLTIADPLDKIHKTVETDIKLLDVVALTEDLPDRGLRRGQVNL